jgi:hypothetical protein
LNPTDAARAEMPRPRKLAFLDAPINDGAAEFDLLGYFSDAQEDFGHRVSPSLKRHPNKNKLVACAYRLLAKKKLDGDEICWGTTESGVWNC